MTFRSLSPLLLLLLGSGAAPALGEQDAPPSARQLVQRAFDDMFNYPSVRSIELHIHRNERRVSYRAFDVAYQKVNGLGHTALRFTAPEYLRDNAFLIVETKGGKNDAWLYQPDEKRIRRIGIGQKGDPFYGSDLAYEDLEHHAWGRFSLKQGEDAMQFGEPAYVVEAVPPADSHYGRMKIFIEKRRHALLRVDFHRGSSDEPLKQMLIEPAKIERLGNVLVPRELRMQQIGRDAYTLVEISRIEVDPQLTRSAFSTLRLRNEGQDLFDLIDEESRRGESGP